MAHRMPLQEYEFILNFSKFCRSQGKKTYNPVLASSCALAKFSRKYAGAFWGNLNGVPPAAYKAAVMNTKGAMREPFSALADRLEAILVDAPGLEKV